MKKSARGFSLIEAMISMLVLTIGLLGLGQLQARLWSASGNLHSTAEAYLMGASYIEKSLSLATATPLPVKNTFTETSSNGTPYNAALTLVADKQLINAEIRIQWQDQTGPRSIGLQTAANNRPGIVDTRWLLPQR